MASPLIFPDDEEIDPKIVAYIRRVLMPLQANLGSDRGMGKWRTVLLGSLRMRTDTVGSILTFNNQSGYVRYTIIGDTMLLTVDTRGLFTVGGLACGRIDVEIPDGYIASPRQPIGGHNDDRVGWARALIMDPVTGASDGIINVGNNDPKYVSFVRTGGNIGVGSVGLFGNVPFECRLQGDGVQP